VSNSSTPVERTLILVKPDGVRRGLVGEVIRRIESKGYKIAALRMLTADKDLLATHYAEHQGKRARFGQLEMPIDLSRE
jgi:nucleoside-diphosphate kinase